MPHNTLECFVMHFQSLEGVALTFLLVFLRPQGCCDIILKLMQLTNALSFFVGCRYPHGGLDSAQFSERALNFKRSLNTGARASAINRIKPGYGRVE